MEPCFIWTLTFIYYQWYTIMTIVDFYKLLEYSLALTLINIQDAGLLPEVSGFKVTV